MLLIVIIVIVLLGKQGTAGTEQTKAEKIKELEKQKSDLFLQINDAIDESVRSLLKTNDSEATMGLEYLRDLKEHIKELNETDKNMDSQGIEVDSKSDLENRRRYKGINFHKKPRKIKDDPFDFESVLKPKNIKADNWKKMIANRLEMQKQLDTWILERQKEKERLDKYRLEKKRLIMSGKYEKCPRFGYQGRKKKEKNDKYTFKRCKGIFGKELKNCPDITKHDDDSIEKNMKMPLIRKYKYPCCRKCCKKSYMGCL